MAVFEISANDRAALNLALAEVIQAWRSRRPSLPATPFSAG